MAFVCHGLFATVVLFSQVELTEMPQGGPGLLFQVIDSGVGLKGADFRTLFDPTHETGVTPYVPFPVALPAAYLMASVLMTGNAHWAKLSVEYNRSLSLCPS